MSRLTSFHKAMPEDIPRPVQLPASPPETELDQMILHSLDPSVEMASDAPASRFRRVASTASYVHSSPARESRPVGPRTSRWLVVVFPPQSLTREPAVLGHTLSTSAAGRFSNGILMPLFPTMYGQLTAIAREFGLPSVSGICIYLRVTDAGLEMTPRISDETWHMLWGHFFDATTAPQPATGLPISGKIEFDIDIRKARWYQAWVGAARGDLSVAPSVAPSAAYHRKRESRSTLFGDEDARSENGLFPLQLASSSRATVVNKPQRLNLLNKNDDSPIATQSTAQRDVIILDERSPPSDVDVMISSKLSPVPQEDEPATAKLVEVDRRVLQWRIASGSSPNPPSNKTGQISLDPAHLPNSAPDTPAEGRAAVDIEVVNDDDEGVELNLDDFDWSISSAGPQSYIDSPTWPEPLPSVHLEWRVQGSVPPTPSTVTTAWPYDYPDSPFSLASRVPSPDIAYRMIEDAPCTPTTATSWGPASYPASPAHSDFYAPSVDLAQRLGWSRPVTPSTSTSWGPEEDSRPPSPIMASRYSYTPEVADRTLEDEMQAEYPRAVSFPYYSAWTREPWACVWPYQQPVGLAQNTLTSAQGNGSREPWGQVWPYRISTVEIKDVRIESLAYPFSQGIYPSIESNNAVKIALPGSFGYPFTNGIYPSYDVTANEIAVAASKYPFTQGVYPLRASLAPQRIMLPGSSWYPFIDGIYPTIVVSPADVGLSTISSQRLDHPPTVVPQVAVNLLHSYPFIQESLYPAVYPYSVSAIYPQVNAQKEETLLEQISSTQILQPSVHPYLEIYLAGYPNNLKHIYPVIFTEASSEAEPISVRLPLTYPALTIYDAVYPNFDIYPEPSAHRACAEHIIPWRRSVSTKLDTHWPALTIYCAEYPYFDIYPGPAITNATTSTIQPVASHQSLHPLPVKLPAFYPAMDDCLYPAAYPYSLDNIYPITHYAQLLPSLVSSVVYPFTEGIYPAVYPFSVHNVYPAESSPTLAHNPVITGAYPFVDGIYPAVYPHNLDNIYFKSKVDDVITVQVAALKYPFLSGIYPDVYPHNMSSIYPGVLSSVIPGTSFVGVDCRLGSSYPYIQLYDPQYPHVCPYPSAWMSFHEGRPNAVRRRSLTPPRHHVSRHRDGKTHAVRVSLSRQLNSETAPPVPPIPAHVRTPSTSPASSRPSSITLHDEQQVSSSRRSRRTHKELHDRVSVDVQYTDDVLELSGFLDQFPTPVASPSSRRTHEELRHLTPTISSLSQDDLSPVAGSSRVGGSPTSFSLGHGTRGSLVLEKIKQFSPVDDNVSPSLSRSSSQSRPISRLDRSKYPFV